MKKIIVTIFGGLFVMAMTACVFFEASAGGREAGDFDVLFDRNGFAVINDADTTAPPVIFENRAVLDIYIQKIVASMDWLKDFPEHKSEMQRGINEFYSRYDDAFFSKYKLIVAHIDSGSGSLSFDMNNMRAEQGTLVVNINRHTPHIQTMDYNRHIMFLSVARSYAEFDSVKIVLETVFIKR